MARVDAEVLARYRHWRVFGGGSWSSPVPPNRHIQRKILLAFFFQVAKHWRIPFHRLIWAARFELGEKTQREHYHWLIGSQDVQPTIGQMFELNALWDSFPHAGYSKNTLFDERLNGADYISKVLYGSDLGGNLGADFYESGKFGHEANEVEFSKSFLFVIGGKRLCVERDLRAGQRGEKRTVERGRRLDLSEWTQNATRPELNIVDKIQLEKDEALALKKLRAGPFGA